jgi:hypothetical protein
VAAATAAADPDDDKPLAAAVMRQLSGLLCDASAAVVKDAAATARLVLAARISRAAMPKYLSPLVSPGRHCPPPH